MNRFLPLALLTLSFSPMAFAQDRVAADAVTEAATDTSDAAATDTTSAHSFSWNASLASDYVYRGVSLNDERVALQGGVDYSHASGFYAGIWATQVDIDERVRTLPLRNARGPDEEVDFYVGYNRDLGADFNADISLTRYMYYGEERINIEYSEVVGRLTYKDTAKLIVGYTDSAYGKNSARGLYTGLEVGYDLPKDIRLTAGVGHTKLNRDVLLVLLSGSRADSYQDYSVGVSRDFGKFNASLNYYDTNSDAKKLWGKQGATDGHVVVKFTYAY